MEQFDQTKQPVGAPIKKPKKEQIEDDDDETIRKLLNDPTAFEGLEFAKGEDQEKADNAVDYEDFSDDELPDEEAPSTSRNHVGNMGEDDEDTADDGMEDLLFEGGRVHDNYEDNENHNMKIDPDDLFGDVHFSDLPPPPPSESVWNEVMGLDMSMDETGSVVAEALQSSGPNKEREESSQEGVLDRVKRNYPSFKEHAILSIPTLVRPRASKYVIQLPKITKPLVPSKFNLEVASDDAKLFRQSSKALVERNRPGIVTFEALEDANEDHEITDYEELFRSRAISQRDIQMACVIWNIDDDHLNGVMHKDRPSKRLKTMPSYIDMASQHNDMAVFRDEQLSGPNHTVLDLNDPYLLVDVRQADETRKPRRIGGEFKRQRINKDLTQRYNISNDEAYELLKENRQSKVRSTIGQLSIEHTMPAIRLQTPYYRTRLSKTEARSFHRPSMSFPPESEIRFTKIKTRKKKHMRGKDIQTIFDKTHTLSLNDNANFVLMEYSEEHPYVLSNFGMGSRIINYYRRKSVDDDSRPKSELGELQVLMQHDRSPFWNFGSVPLGETVLALYNRMVRAPIFKHTPKSTDFLVIRNSDSRGAYYFIRTIPHLFVVGQTFPVVDVPGPHSRKVTTASKNRLRMVCYRVARRRENGRISVKDISPHFPENNDMQNRQKMKEFMSFQKEKERGYWQMKPGEMVPDETSIRAMVTPETVCLLDGMQVGVRYLEDAGYGKAVEEGDEDDEKDGMSVEQQLAPWIATRNFINATSGKAMLKLHGEGDPSSRGEAFSFVRTSMKGGFKAIGESVDEKLDAAKLKALGGHSYNVARQQASYEEAIERIWKAQQSSLSNTEENVYLDMEDIQGDDNQDELFQEGRTPRSEAVTPAPWSSGMNGDDEVASQFSRLSQGNTKNKLLKIFRDVQRPDGTIEKQAPVIIKDPKIIRMYLRRRLEIDTENIAIESLKPTGNEDEDKRNKKILANELSRLKRNKERREARERQGGKKGFNVGDGSTTPGSGGSGTLGPGGKVATTRKCANCGMLGHIKTNRRVCPAYKEGGALYTGATPVETPGDSASPGV